MSTTRRRLAPEVRSRRAAKRRRARNRRGMSKEDKVIANGYREAIAKDPCFYCGERRKDEMHTDHFISLARGGTSHWYNLVRSCAACNYAKNTKCGLCYMGIPCRNGCRPLPGYVGVCYAIP